MPTAKLAIVGAGIGGLGTCRAIKERSTTKLIDSAAQMAEWILENWKFEQSGAPDRWFTTGITTKLVGNGHRAFGVTIKNPGKIIL